MPAAVLCQCRCAGVVLAAALIATVAPASARATMTLSLSNGIMEIGGDGDVDLLNVQRRDDGFARVDLGFNATVLTLDTCDAPDEFGVTICDPPDRVVANLGAGNDQVQFMDYPLTVDLGPGDDHAISGAAADAIVGGPGRDDVDYSDVVIGNARRGGPVTVTLNGAADDGEVGEGDNIDSSVELIEGTGLGDHFVGDDGAQELNGAGGNDVLEGGGGDDYISGSAGDDTIDGGAGNDELYGNVDSDTITGGPGRDKVRGDDACTIFTCGIGNDMVFVRDGEIDDVDCGLGTDRAVADNADLVANCDVVDRPGGGGGGAGGGGGSVPAPPSLSVPSSVKMAQALRRGLAVSVSCPAGCRATAVARVTRRTARKLHLRSTTIGRAPARTLPAGQTSLRLRLSARARKRLRHARSVTVKITATMVVGTTRTTQSAQTKLHR
jgi:RTX calcium-binding nonapeptide repeat (4 copies)